jgi:hypothetical protein
MVVARERRQEAAREGEGTAREKKPGIGEKDAFSRERTQPSLANK